MLRALFDGGLPPDSRSKIFPGDFDLGNGREMGKKARPLDQLADELGSMEGKRDTAENPMSTEDARYHVHQVSDLLGHGRNCPSESGQHKIFKITALIHEFKQRSGLSQLLSILKAPHLKSPSLDLTNPYAVGEGSDLRKNIIDLQTRCMLEIPPSRLEEIDASFNDLRDFLNVGLNRIERAVKSTGRPSYEEVVRRYELLADSWSEVECSGARRLLPADEQLYIKIHELDFLNFAGFEIDTCGARRLTMHWLSSLNNAKTLQLKNIRISDLERRPVPEAVIELLRYVNKAAGIKLDRRQFRSLLGDAAHYLRIISNHQHQISRVDFDAISIIAAIIVSHELRKRPVRYKTGLAGTSRGKTGSVRAALMKYRLGDEIPEEYLRILVNGVRHARYRICGQEDVADAQFRLRKALLDRASDAVRTHDTRVVEAFLSRLEECSYSGVESVLKS